MDLRNIPYRSDVAAWNPDELAEYFKTLKYKDCEKVVRKYNINGQRFLNMSENDIQKFPKLRVPIISKLSQEINRNEGRISFFPKRPPTQKFADQMGYSQEEDGGWSSFDEEEDDYESPDNENEQDDGADYESPSEEPGEAGPDSDDYEPPPSNDAAHHNVIFPAKSIPSNTDYIDRPTTARSSLQPPIPPQRPGSSPTPSPYGGRGLPMPSFPPPSSNNDVTRDRSTKPLKPPAPSIDRSTKPSLDRPGPPYERESPVPGKRPPFPEKSLTPNLRSLGEQLAKIQKPPIPPTERYERGHPTPGRKLPPIRQGWAPEKKPEEEEETVPQRSVPQLSLPPYSSNTFPSRSAKPPPKPSPSGSNSMPGAYGESTNSLSSGGSLPSRFQLGHINRSPSRGTADSRPPLPVPNRQMARSQNTEENEDLLNEEWYVAYISRAEAEGALRKINKDGTFLVRDSSGRNSTHPYVLMVLYRGKVYNIQIRYQENEQIYMLGTGLKGREDFSSVADIIQYFQKTPLLLIDGKDRGSRNQCMLTYAAGHA
ncbi:lymphocyte cytosolic protein 2 [Alligator mississippiensis]|uniref:Lymphocyte cytosolic protein 2 n=1 Tax=Alligator mississippiensis TaxID=8496 RepID=A0A151NR34_ALLMI|nr:lymphocyte cytosolic protein 2 [Alligator mississippiensis]KYO39248.1 lymphocyte cytosolic protein 2 [Alligator mississippiensis]